MNQHEAATVLANALHQGGVSSVRTLQPIDGAPTVVIASFYEFDLSLSVTVEILASP